MIEALERYVAALEELGSVTPALLRPGTPRDEVEAKLVASGVHAHPDVVDLYSWSSGTGDDGPPLFVDLRLISFSSALRIRNDMLEVARQAALDHEQASPDDYFRSSWISFGWSAPMLVVETDPGPTQGHLLAVKIESSRKVADSIASLVDYRRQQLIDGKVEIEDGGFRRPPVKQIVLPVEVIRIRAGREVLIPAQLERVHRGAAAALERLDATVAVTHSSVGDIPDNSGLELFQRDLVLDTLVAAGVDRRRIMTDPVPLGEDKAPSHHILGIYLR